ncbi:MAG: Smr/MutS family protein, partial [Erysipelotrichaceae bacterium]|nr:Smr/MutS family protein [Erysipelotrichaceae bacterium]
NRNISNIHSASASFIAKNGAYLQENNAFIRNDRVAFLLKNSAKNKFNGYQYGNSASGLATYVEPDQFIELNNEKLSLENEKLEEVNRILKELTAYVSYDSESYILNFESLMKLDVIFAKAEYGFYKGGIIASISDDASLYIKDVAHPLIDPKTVVCNTYSLHDPYQGIVISGTNTGGKTVGLKLIGLSVLMSYLGIPVLASEARIPLFNEVYIDIDDNQSISNALSTFSAHITNINSILKQADENSLILIDELISGTDPKEAQAISLAILERIIELKSRFVITTHYDDIKQFAYNNERILLSSVGFDLENLKPTYRYLENSVGVSNAIDIASRYFEDERIILKAREYIDLNKSKEDELLDKLSKEISENEALKDSLNEEIRKNDELSKELDTKLQEFEKEKSSLYERYKKELNEYMDDIKEKAKDKLESLSDVKEKKTFMKEIEELKIEAPEEETVVFEVGDNVKVGESSQSGEITEINGDNVSVNINGLIVKTKLDNLVKLPKKVKKEYKPRQRMSRVSSELNLVGERVEDALAILDNYLDNAYGSGLKTVKIIHGFGTGQLRNGIRNHLKKYKTVAEFGNGDTYDGGSNVTIVKFK